MLLFHVGQKYIQWVVLKFIHWNWLCVKIVCECWYITVIIKRVLDGISSAFWKFKTISMWKWPRFYVKMTFKWCWFDIDTTLKDIRQKNVVWMLEIILKWRWNESKRGRPVVKINKKIFNLKKLYLYQLKSLWIYKLQPKTIIISTI